MKLTATKLAGSDSRLGRVDNDYYATNPQAVEMLLDVYPLKCTSFLEPCVGGGHIADVIINRLHPNHIKLIDIVNRGYPNTEVTDYLTYNTNEKFDLIVTNPPYSLAQEFVEKGMSMLNENGCMALFLKIQFLESKTRSSMFKKYPPKYIYVFTKRMGTWRNGEEFNKQGKRRATTMCHAWFVWEKGFCGETVIRHLI